MIYQQKLRQKVRGNYTNEVKIKLSVDVFQCFQWKLWEENVNYFSTVDHAWISSCWVYQFHFNKVTEKGIYIYKNLIDKEIRENWHSRKSSNDPLLVKSFLFWSVFLALLFSEMISIIHYAEGWILIFRIFA